VAEPETKTVRGATETDDAFVLNPAFVDEVTAAVRAGDEDYVRDQVLTLHFADAADLIDRIDRELRRPLLEIMRPGFNPEILVELDPVVRDEVLETFGYADVAALISELDSDDAVYLLGQLDEEERAHVVARLAIEDRTVVEQGLAYPEYTAGRLMQRELVAVPSYWTVGEAIDYLRSDHGLPEDFHVLFVVDPRHRPLGMVRLSTLLRARRPIRLRDIMNPEMERVSVTMDQEEVAHLFRNRNLLSAPVCDNSGRLIGRVTIDDIVDVIDEEAEDDMLRLAGLSEASMYTAVLDTTKSRFSWLVLNLATAVVASLVIGVFEATIEQVVALAVLMPIVASMGGNAGTQTLTVAVRGLAMRELVGNNARRVLGREILVGAINGVLFAVLAGVVALVWFGDPLIAAVIGAAMVVNMVVAGLSGIAIPLGLDRLKIDPALASGVFLTTVTDVVGFFAFLGLAAAVLL